MKACVSIIFDMYLVQTERHGVEYVSVSTDTRR